MTIIKGFYILVALALLLTPAAAQQETQIDIRLDTADITAGSEFTADILVRDGSNIAGADIAIAVDGNCLQVEGMTPGTYLPSSAENGGFAPMNTYDATTARLAANITNRQYIANGDGVFMSVRFSAQCAEQSSTIEVTRAQLVTADGESLSAAFVPVSLEIGGRAPVDIALPPIDNPQSPSGMVTLLLGLMLFSLIGFVSLVSWQLLHTRLR